MEAKLLAKQKMRNERTPKILNDNLLSLVGLKVRFRKNFKYLYKYNFLIMRLIEPIGG